MKADMIRPLVTPIDCEINKNEKKLSSLHSIPTMSYMKIGRRLELNPFLKPKINSLIKFNVKFTIINCKYKTYQITN
jgi:hypothetical protein